MRHPAPRLVLAALALWSAAAFAQQTPEIAREAVRIDVTLAAPESAAVRERIAPGGSVVPVAWQLLRDRCAVIDSVFFANGSNTRAVSPSAGDPWVSVTVPADVSGSAVDVRYNVHLSGRLAVVPIVMPAATIGDRGAGAVRVRLTIDPRLGRAHPVFPAMHLAGAGEWESVFPAMPSVVRIALDDSIGAPCAGTMTYPSAGRFLQVFFSFVAVLVLWVPLYLWWARRSRDSHA